MTSSIALIRHFTLFFSCSIPLFLSYSFHSTFFVCDFFYFTLAFVCFFCMCAIFRLSLALCAIFMSNADSYAGRLAFDINADRNLRNQHESCH